MCMMGNLSSCGRSNFHAASAAVALPPSPPHIAISPAAARVLLVDGGALTFTSPIKVISLLLDYPFHIICPLDSLRPGQHSLSSLLPDEELELGQLYLLLPLKTFENRECMPNMEPLIRRNRLIISSRQSKMVQSQMTAMRLGVIKDQHRNPPKSAEAAKESEESARLLSGHRSDVGSSDSDNLGKVLYVGDSNSRRFLEMSESLLSREKLIKRKLTSVATFSGAGFHSFRERQSSSTSASSSHGRAPAKNEDLCSRICDTPELKMAYRSIMLRRCRSWTPRLQPITENKLPQVAHHP